MSNPRLPKLKATFSNLDSSNGLICLFHELSDPQRNQFHSGLLYRQRITDNFKLLHLQWHKQISLTSNFVNKRFIITESRFDMTVQKYLAGWAEHIWNRNKKNQIPYGFSNPSGVFDKKTGRNLLRNPGDGLTCSTFILAIFDSADVPYMDLTSFQPRTEDIQWEKEILDLLSKSNQVTNEHILEMKKVIGLICRYRPYEVVAASLLDPIEAKCPLLIHLGEKLALITTKHHHKNNTANTKLIYI